MVGSYHYFIAYFVTVFVTCIQYSSTQQTNFRLGCRNALDCAVIQGNTSCVQGICLCLGDAFLQISLPRPSCVLRKYIGQECTNDYQCSSPYTYCAEDSSCRCKTGFDNFEQVCIPSGYNCPFGQPLREGGSLMPCYYRQILPNRIPGDDTLDFDPTRPMYQPISETNGQHNTPAPSANQFDTCPTGYTCFPHSRIVANQSQLLGHCCVTPIQNCPVADALEGIRCSALLPPSMLVPSSSNVCPSATHFCLQEPGESTGVCCPKPCNDDSAVYMNGRCLFQAGNNQSCEIDDQCTNIVARCLPIPQNASARTCQCEDNAVYVQRLGACSRPRCILSGATVEPSRDETGAFIRCTRNGPIPLISVGPNRGDGACPVGQECDPYYDVCCPAIPRLQIGRG